MPTYRVVDMRPDTAREFHAIARSPEKAASDALQINLVRSGVPRNLICRVYWNDDESTQLNVVRLYRRREPLH